MSQKNVVVVVRPEGPLRYDSLTEALDSAHVKLEHPIYHHDSRIDKTYLRGDAYADFTGVDPWDYLLRKAVTLPEPIKRAKRFNAATLAYLEAGVVE